MAGRRTRDTGKPPAPLHAGRDRCDRHHPRAPGSLARSGDGLHRLPLLPGPRDHARVRHGRHPSARPRALAGGHDLAPTLDWHLITDGDSVAIGDQQWRFSRTDHPVETLAPRVDSGGRSFAFSADTGEDWSFARLGGGIDLALCEATFLHRDLVSPSPHLSALQAGAMAADAGVGRLLLTHLAPRSDAAAFPARSHRVVRRPGGTRRRGSALRGLSPGPDPSLDHARGRPKRRGSRSGFRPAPEQRRMCRTLVRGEPRGSQWVPASAGTTRAGGNSPLRPPLPAASGDRRRHGSAGRGCRREARWRCPPRSRSRRCRCVAGP